MTTKSMTIYVEGRDDQAVIEALLDVKSITGVSVKSCDSDRGVNKELEKYLSTIAKGSGPNDIRAIVLDADNGPASRWASFSNILVNNGGYTGIPRDPDPRGTVVRCEGKPTIGIWIMPDNSTLGMLEDFVLLLIPEKDKLLDYAKSCIEKMDPSIKLFGDCHKSKVLVHTWLAWQKKPGKPMGTCIKSGALESSRPAAIDFFNWLENLRSA